METVASGGGGGSGGGVVGIGCRLSLSSIFLSTLGFKALNICK